MAILLEVAIGALQADLGVDVHHVDRLAGIDAGGHELALAFLAPLLRIIGIDDLAPCIEQIALAVALEDRAEVPAVAVIIGELGVLQRRVQIVDIAQEVDVGPLALGRCALGVAIGNRADFGRGGIFLLLGPHRRRVALVIPHGVAEERVQEDIGLVHVAVHALAGRDRAGEDVAQRVALFLLLPVIGQRVIGALARPLGIAVVVILVTRLLDRTVPAGLRAAVIAITCRVLDLASDSGIDRDRLPVAAILRVGQRMARFAVIGVDHVAARTARMAIIARLVIGAHEPGEGIVEAGLVDVERRDRDAQAGGGTAVRLLEVGPPRLFQTLDRARGIGQADFGELRVDRASAALEHAEHIARRDHVPGGERIHLGEHAARDLIVRQLAPRPRARRGDLGRIAVAGIGLAEQVVLVGQDPVIVARPAPQHRAGRHDRAFRRLDRLDVAGSAGLARDAVVRGVHELDELGAFLVEQRVGPLGIGRGREVPAVGIFGQHMRLVARSDIGGIIMRELGIPAHACIAAVAIGAAQPHRGRHVHGRRVGFDVAGVAAFGLGVHFRDRLPLRRRRREHHRVVALDRLLLVRRLRVASEQRKRENQRRQQQREMTDERLANLEHQ